MKGGLLPGNHQNAQGRNLRQNQFFHKAYDRRIGDVVKIIKHKIIPVLSR